MFGLLSDVFTSVYNRIIGIEPVQLGKDIVEDVGSNLENATKEDQSIVANGTSASSSSSEESGLNKDQIATKTNAKINQTFHGTVTSLYTGRGLIDDHIYFSHDVILGNAKLKIGTKVIVEAMRTNEQGGWVAKKVSLLNEWDFESDSVEKVDEINGIVSYFNGISGLINDKYSFSRALCIGLYYPMVNDFVSFKVKSANGNDEEVISVKALREKEFVGYVTNVLNKYGFIDEDIFFPIGACKGYNPRIGDCVLVTAIEAKQRKSQWRAYRVGKCSNDMKLKYGDLAEKKPQGSTSLRIGPSYSRHRRAREVRDERQDSLLLPGQRPTRRKKMFLPKHLKPYSIPTDIKACVFEGRNLEELFPDLIMPLSMGNHRSKFDALLFIEEIDMDDRMREFDMQMVTLRHHGEYLLLSVPGLAEGRPSAMIGDRVIIDVRDSPQHSPRYEGFVHEVRAEDVLLKFNNAFHQTYRSEDCDAQFVLNRTTVRRFHQAVEYSHGLGESGMALSPEYEASDSHLKVKLNFQPDAFIHGVGRAKH